MRAITIKQPWASLIVEGIKDVENRTWRCPQKYIGKRVLVHAGSTCEKRHWSALNENQLRDIRNTHFYNDFVDNLPAGAIIGSVKIVDCVVNHKSVWAEKTFEMVDQYCKTGCYGTNKCTNKCFNFNSKENDLIYNWVLANPIKFSEPIPCRGKLSFWEYPNILAEPEEENWREFCHCQIPVKL